MHVGVVEAGDNGAPVSIDEHGLRAPQALDLAVAAHAQDLIASHGHGFGKPARPVRFVHLRVVHDEIDRPLIVVALRAHHQPGDEGDRHDSDDDVGSDARRHSEPPGRMDLEA